MPLVDGNVLDVSSGDELEFAPVWLGLEELSVESEVPELGVGGVGASSRLFSEPSLLDLTYGGDNQRLMFRDYIFK